MREADRQSVAGWKNRAVHHVGETMRRPGKRQSAAIEVRIAIAAV
jgi:hypothetical protein